MGAVARSRSARQPRGPWRRGFADSAPATRPRPPHPRPRSLGKVASLRPRRAVADGAGGASDSQFELPKTTRTVAPLLIHIIGKTAEIGPVIRDPPARPWRGRQNISAPRWFGLSS